MLTRSTRIAVTRAGSEMSALLKLVNYVRATSATRISNRIFSHTSCLSLIATVLTDFPHLES